jgi:hypothetical protein
MVSVLPVAETSARPSLKGVVASPRDTEQVAPCVAEQEVIEAGIQNTVRGASADQPIVAAQRKVIEVPSRIPVKIVRRIIGPRERIVPTASQSVQVQAGISKKRVQGIEAGQSMVTRLTDRKGFASIAVDYGHGASSTFGRPP